MTLPSAFWEGVDRSGGPGACWPWIRGRNNQGYGFFNRQRVTRLLMADAVGRRLATAEFVCHHCDNPPCVNPAHLYLGDNATNQRDRWVHGRASSATARREVCGKGHQLTDDNVVVISGKRRCAACYRDYSRARVSTPESRARNAAYARLSYARKKAAATREAIEAVPLGPLPRHQRRVRRRGRTCSPG